MDHNAYSNFPQNAEMLYLLAMALRGGAEMVQRRVRARGRRPELRDEQDRVVGVREP